MKKRTLLIIFTVVALTTLLLALSGCSGSDPELSGRYVCVENSSRYLVFAGNTVTLYEDGIQVRSGTYRFDSQGALILNFEGFTERYTLSENNETLYHGNFALDNAGETAFIKED